MSTTVHESPTGLIFDVQGHSVHDGPGCRTLVFLCGCPLRCKWCSNPEGMLPRPRLLFRDRLCDACPTRCVDACTKAAITVRGSDGALVSIDRARCVPCTTFDCVTTCYRQALQISAREWPVEELMRVLRRDQQFWGAEGGVTFSGGEPLGQHLFLMAVLEQCRQATMHVAIETSAVAPTAHLLDVLPYVSWLFIDLKHVDSGRHREGTGMGNEQVLRNLSAVAASGWKGRLVVRTTVVPGFNDDCDQARAAAELLAGYRVREVNLLPFHRLGASKYAQLGLQYAYADTQAPDAELMQQLAGVYRAAGINCHIGSNTPF